MLLGLNFALDEPLRAVVVGDPATSAVQELIAACHSVHQPHKVVLGHAGAVESFAKSLPVQSTARVHVCTGNSCRPPVALPAEVRPLITSGN
jgi:uncharacterized protein YyaL (SSP411 family)